MRYDPGEIIDLGFKVRDTIGLAAAATIVASFFVFAIGAWLGVWPWWA